MLFERESRREKILEARQRELKLKERERSGKARVDEDAPKRKIFLSRFFYICNPKITLFYRFRKDCPW